MNYATKYNSQFEDFVSLCETVTEYYIEERYPFIIKSELTKIEIEENLEKAKALINRILHELGLSQKFNRANL